MPAAGAASLIKAALALYHKVLPPSLCDRVNEELALEQTPFYLNTAPRPWIRGTQTPTPRRAGVNAFGFGGINAHVILEEYPQEKQPVHLHTEFPSELLVWITSDRETLLAQLQQTQKILQQGPHISLAEIACSLSRQAGDCQTWGPWRLAVVASDREDALHKVNQSLEKIANSSCDRWQTRNGIYFAIDSQLASRDRVAFLFPGEGSQYPHMLGDLALHFPQVRARFDFLDATFADTRKVKPSQLIFPASNSVTSEAKAFADRALYQMDCASEMVFVANLAMYDLLQEFGLKAAAMVGHSSGENSVLIASGMVKLRDGDPWRELAEQMRQLNRIYQELEDGDRIAKGSLLAVGASDPQTQSQILQEWAGKVYIAMHNCPNQTILFGSADAIAAVSQQLQASGAICTLLPFDRAYHTPLFAPVSQAFRQFYNTLNIATPHTTVYSCSLADRFPESAHAIRDAIARQWSSPVRFWDTIETLYQRGIRSFVEVGPNSNLTGFVQDILRNRVVAVLASNDRRRSGISQLQHMVASLAVHGAAVNLAPLYRYRTVSPINLDDPPQPPQPAPLLNLNMPILKLTPALVEKIRLQALRHSSAQVQLSSNADRLPEVASSVVPAEKQVEPPAARIGIAQRQPEIEAGANAEPAITPKATLSPPSCNERNQIATDIPEPQPAIQQHFHLMQEFLASQERIAATLFKSCRPAHRFPCLGKIVERSDRHLYSVYRVTLERDIYLHDHTLGAPLSAYHRDLLPLPVIPFTLSLETIVEAAVCLAGGDRVAMAVEEVQGHRWLALDGGELRLGIDARVISKTNENVTAVRVQVFQLEGNESGEPILAFSGTVKLAIAYPRSPQPLPFHLSQPAPSRWRDRDLYTTGMFHGPRFQGVKHLRCWGTEGIEAELVTISTANFFKSYKNAALQIDAGLLDAAGQLVAYWVSERSNMDFHVFPFRVRAFEFYSAPLPADTSVLCRGTMAYVSDRQIDAQFDLFDPQGRIIARILGWQDVFFTVPPRFCKYRLAPQTFSPSQPWIQEQLGVYCRRMDAFDPGFLENAGELLGRVLAHLSFNRSERDFWYALPTGRRRRSWLLGRIAAKDCIRAWAQQQFQLSLAPVDIEILPNAAGQPVVRCPQLAERTASGERSRTALPAISIAHDGDFAVAVLVPPPQSVGVDLQKLGSVRMEDVVPLAFSDRERQRWGLDDPKTAIALWCAKEAAAKAAGTGLQGNPQAWQISEYTGDRAIVTYGDRSFSVRLAWHDKWAVALCLWLPASSELSPQQMLV